MSIADRLDEIVIRQMRLEMLIRVLLRAMRRISENEAEMIMDLKDLQDKADTELAQIKAETDVVNAVKMVVDNQNTKLSALQQQVADLIAAGNPNAADLQKLSDTIDQIMSVDSANAAVVAAAVAAGTPVEPPPPAA